MRKDLKEVISQDILWGSTEGRGSDQSKWHFGGRMPGVFKQNEVGKGEKSKLWDQRNSRGRRLYRTL